MKMAFIIIIGLVLSVWTIIYMRHKGDGNPMDAFNHEIAPRTKHLMTDGPYKINRNPMLTGIFIYLIGICIWLWTWQSVAVFVAFVAIMSVQVIHCFTSNSVFSVDTGFHGVIALMILIIKTISSA